MLIKYHLKQYISTATCSSGSYVNRSQRVMELGEGKIDWKEAQRNFYIPCLG